MLALPATGWRTTSELLPANMTTQIQAQIQQLPDSEIAPLLEWLNSYYDGEVWDRQMEADIVRLGGEEWERRLLGASEIDDGRQAAILRLMNSFEPTTEEKRERFLADLSVVIGEPIGNFSEPPRGG